MSEENQLTSNGSNDWDPLDPEVIADPGREYARLREQCPVPHSNHFGGFWTITGYDEVRRAARNHKEFPSGPRIFVDAPDLPQLVPLVLNPPEHTPYRRALNRYMAPARMDAIEPVIRSDVTELLDPILAAGSAEVVAEFSAILPVRALCRALNLPDDSWDRIGALVDRVEESRVEFTEESAEEAPEADAVASMKRNFETEAQFIDESRRLVEQRKREPLDPDEDIISGLLAGEEIPEDVIVQIGGLFFAAGFVTTKHSLSATICYLAENAADQETLRQEPEKIPLAVEELLRFKPPLDGMTRRANGEVEVAGCPIPDGELVALAWTSANLDPSAFEDPEKVDLERNPNRHLTFGHGIHKCVGAPLARLQLRVALEELLRRTKSFEIDGEAVEKSETSSFFHGGYEKVPIRVERA